MTRRDNSFPMNEIRFSRSILGRMGSFHLRDENTAPECATICVYRTYAIVFSESMAAENRGRILG